MYKYSLKQLLIIFIEGEEDPEKLKGNWKFKGEKNRRPLQPHVGRSGKILSNRKRFSLFCVGCKLVY